MKTTRFAGALAAALVLSSTAPASAQVLQPVPVAPSQLPIPGQSCTAEAQNVTGFMNDDGSFFVFNVPANQGQIRLRATCTDAFGHTLSGQSELVTPIPGGRTDVANLDFGTTLPIPAQLDVFPLASTLVGAGNTLQLAVGSQFADLTTGDVTASSAGTTYRSSNPAVVTVSADGLLTAVATGSAIVSALNEGAMGLMTVTVLSAAMTDFAVSPAAVTLVQNPVYQTGTASLQVTGSLSDGSSADLTSSMSGTTYASSDPSVALVGPNGSLVGLSAGSATITVTSPQTGTSKLVSVLVTAFSPAALAAYDTPGFASNVDLVGNLAFIADGAAGLQILDTTGGAIVGKLAFAGATVLDVRVRGDLAAIALGAFGVGLADVSDPAQPVQLATVATTSATADVSISGDRLYVATAGELLVYDVATPSAPVLLGAQALSSAVKAVAADTTRGVTVALTDLPALEIVQTGGPQPWPVSIVPLPAAVNQADDVVLLGTSAYVANGRGGIVEIELTDLAAPFLRSTSTLDFDALGVAVRSSENGTLVAAADDLFVNAIPFFDVTLANTWNLDFSAFPGALQPDANAGGVALGDGFGVVAVGAAGVQVFRTTQLTDNAGVAPAAALLTPITGSSLVSGDTGFVHATASDDVAVGFVDFLVDGALVATDATSPFQAVFTAGLPCTTQSVTAVATDLAGHTGPAQPVLVHVLCADGQACSSGLDCASGDCSGSVCQSCGGGAIFPSCMALEAACPATASGPQSIDPDGAGPGAPFSVYCEMSLAGGGWTLAGKMTNQDAKHWVDAETSWTGTAFYGAADDLTPGLDAKSEAWGAVPASELMLTDDQSKASGLYVQTIAGCVGGQTLSSFFAAALVGYSDKSIDQYYKQCPTYNNYVPGWTQEPNWIAQGPTSPHNSLNNGYLEIAKVNGGDTQAVVSFYAEGLISAGPLYDTFYETEADVGLGADEQNGGGFATYGSAQDIGGPSSCSNDDAACQAQYPQTVYVFVR